MDCRVVCISRTLAAGGEIVGHLVSERLEFRYVDAKIITQAAEEAHLDPRQVAKLEHRQPWLKRFIDSLATVAVVPGPLASAGGQPLVLDYYALGVPAVTVLPEDQRALIREVIHEVASEGKVVIVAHAASMALAGTPGVLRVFITASPETRAARLSQAGQLLDAQQAHTAVKESDRERRDYLRRFYKISEELPTHYDLVINTDVLTPPEAVNLIVTAARG